MQTTDEILARLRSLASPEDVAGMARFGINPQGTLGISIYTLRKLLKEIERSHALALDLWPCGVHEARILASYIDRPEWVSEAQMEAWALDFDSWDIVDQVCDLFDKTPFAYPKALQWSSRSEEFVKRAGFALMAGLAVHDKQAADEQLAQFLPVILRESGDERNFVKKAVNWALRNIGKRNAVLHQLACQTAAQLAESSDKTARWIGHDALRELENPKVAARAQRNQY
jgi:3-methyladenine DNA glycosylase AlkD